MQKLITNLSRMLALLTGIAVCGFSAESVASESPIVRIRFFRPAQDGYKVVGQCSGFFTSNSGYLLTTRHCLLGNTLSEDVNTELEKDYGHIPQFNILRKAKLYVVLDHGVPSPGERVREAFVISTGAEIDFEKTVWREAANVLKNVRSPGFKLPELKDMFTELAKNGFGPQSDWLVLKVQGVDQTQCLKIASSDTGTIHMVGYPGNKVGDHFGDSVLKVAKGEYDQAQFCFNSLAQEKLKGVTEERKRNEILELTKFLFISQTPTTAAVQAGMSGGPTLNKDGEVVGINRAVLLQCPNSSFYNPMQNIVSAVDRLSRQAGTPSSKEVFDCKM